MSRKKLPKQIRYFLADDIRQEGPKPILIGFYPDDRIQVALRPDQPEPSEEAPVVLHGLSILVAFLDCSGAFESNISLYGPNGKAMFEDKLLEGGLLSDKSAGHKNIYFTARFSPFSVVAFGKYKYVVKLDNKEFSYIFSIEKQ